MQPELFIPFCLNLCTNPHSCHLRSQQTASCISCKDRVNSAVEEKQRGKSAESLCYLSLQYFHPTQQREQSLSRSSWANLYFQAYDSPRMSLLLHRQEHRRTWATQSVPWNHSSHLTAEADTATPLSASPHISAFQGQPQRHPIYKTADLFQIPHSYRECPGRLSNDCASQCFILKTYYPNAS